MDGPAGARDCRCVVAVPAATTDATDASGTGIGAAHAAILMAYIVRVTSSTERTRMLTKLVAVQNIGLFAGPGLNFALRYASGCIGPFPVSPLTVPGLFIACLATLCMLLTAAVFHDPPPIKLDAADAVSPGALWARERWRAVRHAMSLPVATIFLAQFVLLFNQTTLETLVTPLTHSFYQWGDVRRSPAGPHRRPAR